MSCLLDTIKKKLKEEMKGKKKKNKMYHVKLFAKLQILMT
jgi:hypothetical protein